MNNSYNWQFDTEHHVLIPTRCCDSEWFGTLKFLDPFHPSKHLLVLVSTFTIVNSRCFILLTKLNLIIYLIILFYTKRKALSIQSKLFQFGLGCILSAAKFLASLAIAENLIVISAGTFCCIVSADEKCKEHNTGTGISIR